MLTDLRANVREHEKSSRSIDRFNRRMYYSPKLVQLAECHSELLRTSFVKYKGVGVLLEWITKDSEELPESIVFKMLTLL